jgi:hypothetical protein
MFFNAPVSMSLYSRDYYPRYCLGTSCPVPVLASERAWALRYQQQPVNQPNPTALLVHEYDEFPDQQRMMRVLRSLVNFYLRMRSRPSAPFNFLTNYKS